MGVRTALLVLSPRGLPDAAKNLLLWRRVQRDPGALAIWNEYFDAGEYLQRHSDVAGKGVDPLLHFLLRGNREYRDPSPRFRMRSYLVRYPEVADARVNALLHFVLFGKREGRIGLPVFSPGSGTGPWINLPAEPDAAPGFLVALPFVTLGGGAEKLFRTLAQRMVDRGWRVVVITTLTLPESMPDDSESFAKITPHVYRLSTLFPSEEVQYAFLWHLIRRYSIGTVMLAGCEFVYHALPQLKQDFPDLLVVDQLFNDSAHVCNNRHYSEQIDATIVPSELLRASLAERRNDASSIHVIPHGIEMPEESDEPASELPPAARGKIVVGYFGRFSIEKGPDLFVDIVRRLAANPHLFFVMAGAGPEFDRVLRQIRKHRLQERIYTPGFVVPVTPLMRAADIVVLPSRIDGMPQVVLEAQAMGKPVVASRVGSLPLMIEDEKTGFLCEIGDLDAFSKQILKLAGDKDLRDRMKIAAQESIRMKFSADRMLESYERVFRTVSSTTK